MSTADPLAQHNVHSYVVSSEPDCDRPYRGDGQRTGKAAKKEKLCNLHSQQTLPSLG